MSAGDMVKFLVHGASWLRRKKETKEEERFLEDFRKARLDSRGNVVETKPGSELYRLCERLVGKGKLSRNGVAAYSLPDDDMGVGGSSEHLG